MHLALGLTLAGGVLAPTPAHADAATDTARAHYETGLQLFYAREHAQALVEFQRAHQVKPRPATLFMMGQCEYLLGALREARDHYEAYLRDSPTGEFVEVAKDRVQSINRRPATLVINTVPDQVDVRIVAATGGGPSITGQAPNNFAVPRGRWLVAVSKPNYQQQQLVVELDLAETKPLFFKLDPIPARLEIETMPAGATLYVNGNRARNPYRQDVPPGHYEIFAEDTDYEDRAQDLVLRPGERRALVGANAFRLRYVQRSGRPELLFASSVMGGLIGAGAIAYTAVAAQEARPGTVATLSLSLGGAVAGTIGGALIGNRFVPSYIPDNRALFMIAGMWVGAAQGALAGMTLAHATTSASTDKDHPTLGAFHQPAPVSKQLQHAFIGSIPGLALGATAGALMMNRAPTYGRVALIQSAAVGGAIAGGLTAVALRWSPFDWQQVRTPAPPRDGDGNVIGPTPPPHLERVAEHSITDLSLPALIGLNVGLATGLLAAYLPDQSRYGPSWKRIALIDLAAGAGALAAGVGACVADGKGCLTDAPDSRARARTAAIALLGGAAGLAAGIVLTRNVDVGNPTQAAMETPSSTLTVMPMANGRGGVTPMVGLVGRY